MRSDGPPDPERVVDRIQRISAAVFNLDQVRAPHRNGDPAPCRRMTSPLVSSGGATTEVQEMRVAEAAVQAEEASGGGLLPHGSTLQPPQVSLLIVAAVTLLFSLRFLNPLDTRRRSTSAAELQHHRTPDRFLSFTALAALPVLTSQDQCLAPQLLSRSRKHGDASNFTPRCSVTQSQEAGWSVAAATKTITRPGPRVAGLGMRPARLTARLICLEPLTAKCDTANNYWTVLTMRTQRLVCGV